ncbi:MAG: zinc dependent phospholipase C family protein [Candidatus Hydrothermarchaeales archaeon]
MGLTHLCVAYLLARGLGIRENRSLVYLGALLPDLFKLFLPLGMLVGFVSDGFFIGNYFAPFHTVFGVLLSGLFVSSFFEEWRDTYLLILLGAFSHILADIFLWPWSAIMWNMWPVWSGDLGTGIFWPDSVIPLAIAASLCALVLVTRPERPRYL